MLATKTLLAATFGLLSTLSSWVDVASAECCASHACPTAGGYSSMCSSTVKENTFGCCGIGSCNIFCCNCDDGCIAWDNCPASPSKRRRDSATSPALDAVLLDKRSSYLGNCSANDDCTQSKFELLDSIRDVDGFITFREFVEGWKLVDPNFQAALWDKPSTYTDAVAYFNKFDVNGDGMLSLEEASALRS